MFVKLNEEPVELTIVRKNNKNIYFRLTDDLKLSITCNCFVSTNEIIDIIKTKEASLTKMYLQKKKQLKKEEAYFFLGEQVTIIFDENNSKTLLEDNFIFTKDHKTLEKFYKKEAQRVFTERLTFIKPYIEFIPEFTLKIRKMKTRWGVCNKTKKIITLNQELIKKPLYLIDYVIIHELCHFKHPHHQTAFWQEVSNYYPEYKKARKQLRS